MALPEHHLTNLHTLMRAARNGRLCVMEVRDRATGEPVAALCAVSGPDRKGEVAFTPFAVMVNGNPFEMFDPPNPDGGFYRAGEHCAECGEQWPCSDSQRKDLRPTLVARHRKGG